MKKYITIVAIIITSLILITTELKMCYNLYETPSAEYYPMSAIVTNVEENIVYVTNFTGNTYTFVDADGWMINDICALIMNDNGTKSIMDDVIISYKYCGFIE